ncbi:restriction endonuclease subunit S [Anaerobiospirillum succiniciproducens]|uniref:restriction endonuclease subunit S n=1 Tax=Anaerobiospirillum succiniciproducens TaxID=13335 RepID=UPI003F8CE304
MKAPALRFKKSNGSSFNDWTKTTLKSLAHPIRSGSSKKSDHGAYKLYGSTGIIGNTDDLCSSTSPLILAARVGSIGTVNIRSGQFGVSDNTLVIQGNDSCDSTFLYHLIQSKIDWSTISNGTSQSVVSAKKLENYHVNVCCLDEQQKIADFFTALDEKIRIQLNTVDKLNAIKTGMLAKVFSYENTLDWTVRKFDEIFAFNRNFPVSRDQISDECDKTSDNSKIIHYGDILTIYGNIVNPKSDSIGYLVTDVNAKDNDYLCDGDIVFADAAEDYTVGKAIELDGVDCKLLSGLHTIAARPKTTFASGYLSYFFNSPLFKSQVRTLATGTKVMSLTKSSIQTTSISFPSIEEQKKISNLLNTLDNKIAISKKKVEALKQLKNAFMQRMFV